LTISKIKFELLLQEKEIITNPLLGRQNRIGGYKKVSIKAFCFVLLLINLGLSLASQPLKEVDNYKRLKEGFVHPSGTALPKVYWWFLNGNIDTSEAKKELREMKKAGIAGFDFFEIGVPKGDTMIEAGPAFLSEGSLKVIECIVREAGALDLEMGLNLASSWNAGGAWTLPENAGKSLYFSKTTIQGQKGKQKIQVPFPEISFPQNALIGGSGKPLVPLRANGRPVYYEDVAVLAIPLDVNGILDTSGVYDVTRFFDKKNEVLNWKAPPGNWQILRYVCSNSGQQIVLPSPHSAGLTIDHFDSTAVRTHLMHIINSLIPVIGDFRKSALKSFYLASYEARGFVWTPTLPNVFKELNGYDIYKFLPSLYNKELFDSSVTAKVETDFKKTLSELMINNLYKVAKRICNSYGLKINSEAGGPGYPLYNGPAEPLKALGALDIPRGEFWVNHSRHYLDRTGKDSIDILRVVKEVSAASHIYKRGIVEEEAFTSFQHWQEGPFDLKTIGDRAFCEGMNRVVFHGFSHNPRGTGFPGYVYHAGTHFNDKRVWWPMAKPFIDYLARVSYIFQQTNFRADVLYYYGDRVPNSATPKNTHFSVGPGYDYEVVNTEVLLNDLKVKNRKLNLSNGASFSVLVLDKEEEINPLVLMKLEELAKSGAIIIGSKPKSVGTVKNKRNPRLPALVNRIWTKVDDPSELFIGGKAKIFDGITPSEMLNVLNIPPDFSYPDRETWLLDYIHYQKQAIDFYFIRNTSDQWVFRNCSFRQQSGIPEMWNPLNGEVVPIPIYDRQGQYTSIPITLAPYGSCLVVFRTGNTVPLFSGVRSVDGTNPPLLGFSKNGIIFLNEGEFELKSSIGTRRITNSPKTQQITGNWEVSFVKGWGAPDSVAFPELTSWTTHENPGIKYYSGIATYHKTFRFDNKTQVEKNEMVFLDLGEMSKVAEVWLNGVPLGVTWTKPFRFDVSAHIKSGENKLTIKVANTWSNRLTGDAITGEKYTNTNITTSTRNGLPWAQAPLLKSGLIGPVTLQILHDVF